MIRKIGILLLAGVLGLGAELWVNAIHDPGAELGQGDWDTDFWEWHEGDADSARTDPHDSTRAFEGAFSFLTDTKKDPHPEFIERECYTWCYQMLKVPKAVSDIDSCFWAMYFLDPAPQIKAPFFVGFRSSEGNHLRWVMGIFSVLPNDTIQWVEVPVTESDVWREYNADFYERWTILAGWSPSDTIVEARIESWGAEQAITKFGQEVSWDNLELRSIAYYDYAAENIDSDPWDEIPRSYTPVATFSNKGKLDDFSAYVYAEIYRHGSQDVVYKDSAEVNILSDETQQVTFATYEHEPDDAGYSLRVFPLLENDECPEDDTLELQLTSSIEEEPGLSDVSRLHYTSTIIRFSFKSGSQKHLSIYDASGRIVYSKKISPSTNELYWSTSDIPSGLYFYRLTAPTSTTIDKFIVVK